jgi:hypothetical protein
MFRGFLAILLLAVGAHAALADGGRLRIPRDDCRLLVEHRPDPGAAYRPGRDVRGKPVAPADVPGGLRLEPAEEVEFDISFNPLRGRSGSRFGDTELYVGTIRFNLQTGEATFNGAPLTDPEQAELARKCQDVLRRR